MNSARLSLVFSAGALCITGYIGYTVAPSPAHRIEPSIPATPPSTPAAEAGAAAGSPSAQAGNPLQTDSRSAELATLKAGLTRLSAELSALRRDVHAQARDRTAADQAAQKAPEEQAAEDPHAAGFDPVQAERQAQERLAVLENTFQQAQANDTAWSSHAATIVESALTIDNAAGAQVDGLECRSQLCRVELTYQDGAEVNQWIGDFAQRIGETLPSIAAHHTQQDDGATRMILYLFRAGYEPPQTGG